MNRRYFVTLLVGTISGCSLLSSSETRDVYVVNDSPREIEISIEITNTATDEQVLDETTTLSANLEDQKGSGTNVTYDVLDASNDYEFDVAVTDGPSSTFTTPYTTDDQTVTVRIEDGEISHELGAG